MTENTTHCEFAEEISAACAEQKQGIQRRPDLALSYAQAHCALKRCLLRHWKRGCAICTAKQSGVAA